MKQWNHLVKGATGNDFSRWVDVMAPVAEALLKWEGKARDTRVGRAEDWIRKMCNGMKDDATALEMLPAESDYMYVYAMSCSVASMVKVDSR